MLPTHERAHTHARTRPRKVTYSSKQAEHCRQSILGRDCPCRLCPVRNIWRCAPFLKALGTHCIIRSAPRPPTRSAYSPASPPIMVESCVPPAVHVSHSRRRLRGRRPRVTRTSSRVQAAAQSNTTRVRSILCGRPRSRAVPASIACGSRRILWKRLVVGCRRRCAKRILRPPTT